MFDEIIKEAEENLERLKELKKKAIEKLYFKKVQINK